MTMMKLLVSCILITMCISIEFSKNKGILNSEKLPNVRAIDVEDLEFVKEKIFNESENSIVVFHAEWCPHCKEFIPHFDTASQYKLTEGFNFFKVNCHHKAICSFFNVKRYPTIKVFYKGKETEEEPGRDVESILEFVDKLSSPSLIEIDLQKDIQEFGKLYGEGSFIMVYDYKDSDFYKCINKLVNDHYKTLFYVGCIKSDKYKAEDENIKPPALIFSEKHSIYKNWNKSCIDMNRFLENNKYPLIRKLDSFYIKRLQKEEKTLIMVAISVENSVHTGFVEGVFADLSVKNRIYAFSFIDVDQDAYLVSYFKINIQDLPKIIIYDFKDKKFFVDNAEDKNVYSTEDAAEKHISNLIKEMENGKLRWSTGNFLEDILLKFGIKLDQTTTAYILGGCFVLIVLILVIVIFFCGEKNEEDERSRLLIEETNTNKATSTSPTDKETKKNQ